MLRILITLFLAFAVALPAAAEDDAATTFLVKLFNNACVPNMGRADQIRKWAEDRHLAAIDNPTALRVFVGAGGKGAAWALPSPAGSFALSIRGTTEACAVWARNADLAAVEKDFKGAGAAL
jgi:hypothetical protein